MAKKAFNLADFMPAEKVSAVDTAPKVEMIATRKIFANDKNFYDTSDVEQLVNSILINGLLDPLTVRPSGDGEGYIIISGHRRHKALVQILDEALAEDLTPYLTVPCFVREPADDLAEELMLIQANSSTRVLTAFETAQQVKKIEDLFYKLKEQGYSFPGRMRDYVAKACDISASRLARLKVIDGNLIPQFAERFEDGKLDETAAYDLARLPTEQQLVVFESHKSGIQPWQTRNILAALKTCEPRNCTCPHSSERCEIYGKMIDSALKAGYCSCSGSCCLDCLRKSWCTMACSQCKDIQKKYAEELAAQREEARKRDEERRQTREKEQAEEKLKYSKLWRRLGDRRKKMQVEAETFYDFVYAGIDVDDVSDFISAEGCYGITTLESDSPFEYISDLQNAAEMLKCSTDYLLCRTDAPELSSANESLTPIWSTGKPPKSGLYAAKFDLKDGMTMKKLAYYDCHLRKFYFDKTCGSSIEAPCSGWYPVPQDE